MWIGHYDFPETDESGSEHGVVTRMTSQRARALWKKAILETLLLIRMEKENISLQGECTPQGHFKVMSREVAVYLIIQACIDVDLLLLGNTVM